MSKYKIKISILIILVVSTIYFKFSHGTVLIFTDFNQLFVEKNKLHERKTKDVRLRNFFKTDISFTRNLIVKGDKILISNSKQYVNDYFYYEYNFNTKKLTNKYFIYGSRENSILSILSSGIYENNLYIQDVLQDKLAILDLSRNVVKSFNVKDLGYSICLYDTTKAILTGLKSTNKKFTLFDLEKNQETFQFGEYYSKNKNQVVNDAIKQSNEGFIYLKPDGSKALCTFKFSDQFEIINIEDRSIKLVQGYHKFEPAFLNEITSFMQRTEETRFGFINAYVTDDFIYLLFSGERHDTDRKNLGNTIYIYNWNGELSKILKLGSFISALTVTDSQKIIVFDPIDKYLKYIEYEK
ncbi:MAG: TolB-like 6-bladed beta-propeller domain-containing protein [Hydrotalea sp.]|nr:TolB-like 6-bladed beta-propeller domain-containing protein [Hydrotalea sp.]